MSWEGYGQVFCEKGHLHGNWDPYADNNRTEETHSLCPSCKSPPARVNIVDDTNCDAVGHLTDETLEGLLLKPMVTKKCDLGHEHIVEEAVYRIPSEEELENLKSYFDQATQKYVPLPPKKSA